ncbi:MAG: hypothetical protein M3Q00_05255 [Pseudomonadota bacterium]|nr:hypothetical protein [Pseudomonadota bacterium]
MVQLTDPVAPLAGWGATVQFVRTTSRWRPTLPPTWIVKAGVLSLITTLVIGALSQWCK